jgi:quaternary ammonium compound-resistance protein SugE
MRPWPSAATVVAMIASLTLLGLAMRQLPLGTAYAIWVGAGIAGLKLSG